MREPELVPGCVPGCEGGVHWSESGRGHRCGGVVGCPEGKPGCVGCVNWSEGGCGRVWLWPEPCGGGCGCLWQCSCWWGWQQRESVWPEPYVGVLEPYGECACIDGGRSGWVKGDDVSVLVDLHHVSFLRAVELNDLSPVLVLHLLYPGDWHHNGHIIPFPHLLLGEGEDPIGPGTGVLLQPEPFSVRREVNVSH